jgi:transcriptional regulator with XRE-family HTH domain
VYTDRHMGRDSFGRRFRLARVLRELTQRQAAELIGVHAQTISEWERDTLSSLPPAELLRTASEKLRVPFMWLAFNEGRAPTRETRASA